jgi:hypothetical protein
MINVVIAIGGAVIKEDVPFCFFKTPYYEYVIYAKGVAGL